MSKGLSNPSGAGGRGAWRLEVVLDDGVGLFWMWVVLEMPCRIDQRGGGGKVDVEFPKSAQGSHAGGKHSFGGPMFWGPSESDDRGAGVFKHRESAGTRK